MLPNYSSKKLPENILNILRRGLVGELYSMYDFCCSFSNLANLLFADENDQFWQIPKSFRDLINQNGGIKICPNWKGGAKIIHPVSL